MTREVAIGMIKDDMRLHHNYPSGEYRKALRMAISALEQPEIVRCKDCRWWNKKDDAGVYGHCRAENYFYGSEKWEINIRRKYKNDFYCGYAERKEG